MEITPRPVECWDDILQAYTDDVPVSGKVVSITDCGAFVELCEECSAMLHITDIDWNRVRHVNEHLKLGQRIIVKILKIDLEKRRVSVGRKQLTVDPWTQHDIDSWIGAVKSGPIVNIQEYAIWVMVEDGVEVWVHSSELDWVDKKINPVKKFELYEKVDVKIIEVNYDRRAIYGNIKQLHPNPWKLFSHQYQIGDKISGKVKEIYNRRIVVELPLSVEGVVMQRTFNNVFLPVRGNMIDLEITEINVDREYIMLEPVNKGV